MKRAALFCLTGVCFLCGCAHHITAAELNYYKKKQRWPGMYVGYIPGPFFHYGQNKLSESRHFDLGDIPPEVRKITAVIPVFNPGREPLIVEKVDGPCACFAGWDGDKQIAPGQFGAINVLFDKDKIESGPASHFVRINTNDPANSEVKIFFDFNVIRSPEEEEIRLLRDKVQNIQNELQALRKEIRQLTSVKNADDSREAGRSQAGSE